MPCMTVNATLAVLYALYDDSVNATLTVLYALYDDSVNATLTVLYALYDCKCDSHGTQCPVWL